MCAVRGSFFVFFGGGGSLQTLVEQGLFGLYRGMAAPLATVAAFNALLFSVRGFMESTLAHPDGSPLTVGDQAIAGLGAGFAVSFLACPTELAKCRLQAQFGKKPASGGIQHMADGSILYRGPMDVLGHVVKAEGGPTAIFRGLWPTLLREVPGNAVMFGVYEYLKQKLAAAQGLKSTSELGRGSLMLAGGAAGTSFWLATYPLDVIKSGIQVDSYTNPKYRGTWDCTKKMYASEGIRGFWRGFGPCLVRSFPANAVCFMVYEQTKKVLDNLTGES
eukprot:jgi/Botrbrau1/8778/Bobra.0330s0010.3